ncbi:transglutaminase family protein [Candidatus Bathyarchaeota archaeon]|nr:transglutaminase family protein [Candidatus Bathyarchaeota archaeon]
MSYVFENKGLEAINLTKEDVSVPLFLKEPSQSVKIVAFSHNLVDEYNDQDENRWLVVNISRIINPSQKISIFVTYEIESNDRVRSSLDNNKAGLISDIPDSMIQEYCITTSTFMSSNKDILSKAQELTKNTQTVLGKVMNLLDWFIANIRYGNYEVPRYANETFRYLEGDCDDQAILLISMLRGIGIPSYLEVGTYFMPGYETTNKSWDGHLENIAKNIGWHGWAMVYIPPWGWTPVDLTLSTSVDPLTKINQAPEYSNLIVKCFRVSKQDYITESWNTRERVIKSTLYVISKDEATQIFNQPLQNPNIQFLGVSIVILIIALFYLERRKNQIPK